MIQTISTATIDAVTASLQACRAQLHECERAWARSDFNGPPEEDLLSDEQQVLAYRLQTAHLNVVAMLEAADANGLLAEYLKGLEPLKESFDETEHLDSDPAIMFSKPLTYLTQFVDAVRPHLSSEAPELAAGRVQLERLLRQIPAFLHKLGIRPQSENDVCKPARALISSIFPDMTHEFSLPRLNKTYHVDLGVPSLRTGVEFKFAVDEKEFKTSIDGIYADMHGYAGSKDWDNFLAVFYVATPVASEAQIEATFRLARANFNWQPVLVMGPGTRKLKAPPKV